MNLTKRKASQKRYRDKNKEKRNAYNREYYKTYDKDPKKAYSASKKWREHNREKTRVHSRRSHLKLKFGLTMEVYDQLLASQSGCCKICKTHHTFFKDSFSPYLFVDHCHNTGKIRGLLCNSCNSILGYAKDSIEILKAAIQYLE